jgi:hypothetical protein
MYYASTSQHSKPTGGTPANVEADECIEQAQNSAVASISGCYAVQCLLAFVTIAPARMVDVALTVGMQSGRRQSIDTSRPRCPVETDLTA